MPCDTVRPKQPLQERIAEIRTAMEGLEKALLRRRVKVVVGPQGAITFNGWGEQERNGVTDACAYRRIMATGSSIAKMEIARAEQMSGRSVDRRVLAAGVHSHDGGHTWNEKG